jgi:hypothetical protein
VDGQDKLLKMSNLPWISHQSIRSYLATLQKQRENLFDALIFTFQGNPTQPLVAM